MIQRATRSMREWAAMLFQRRKAYRSTFLDEQGKLTWCGAQVLKDLEKFCRFTSSTAVISPVGKTIDPVAMALAEGRREVYLRILGAIHMDQRRLIAMTMETGDTADVD